MEYIIDSLNKSMLSIYSAGDGDRYFSILDVLRVSNYLIIIRWG